MTVDPRCKYYIPTEETPLTHPITLDWFMKNALAVSVYEYDETRRFTSKTKWVYNLISRPKAIRAYLYYFNPRFEYGNAYETYRNMDDAIKKINEAISKGKTVVYNPLKIVNLEGHKTRYPPAKKCKSNVGRMVGNIKGLENSVKKIF